MIEKTIRNPSVSVHTGRISSEVKRIYLCQPGAKNTKCPGFLEAEKSLGREKGIIQERRNRANLLSRACRDIRGVMITI